MSTAVEIAPHPFGHTMIDAMARPLNGWHQEPPYAPRHGYHAQDHQFSPGGRLPGPSSLLSGPPPPPPAVSGREYAAPKSAYYPEYATPSPIQQTPPQLSQPSSDPRSTAMQRRPPVDARLSPTQSSTASDRSDELPSMERPRRFPMPGRHPMPPQVPHLHDPLSLRRDRDNRPALAFPAPQARHGHLMQASQSTSPPVRYIPSPNPEPKSMSIANLLSEDDRPLSKSAAKAPVRPLPSPVPQDKTVYDIRVRQQPVAARSCGFGERDRRVIDPPPIVQLLAEDPDATPEELNEKIRVNCAVVHCSIWNETGEQDNSAMPEDFRQQRRLMGTLVSSPFVGLDENGDEGCFFCFPDLSCRTPGSFRLKFALVILDIARARPGARSPIVATAMSDVFTVYNAKDFPGMTASTPLTKRLKEQGCLISIKKGNEKSTRRDDSDDDDDDDAPSSGNRRKRQRK